MKNMLNNLFHKNKQEGRSKMLYMVTKNGNKYNIVSKNNYLLLENKSILPSVERIMSNERFVSNNDSYYIYIDTNNENSLKKRYENDDLAKYLNSLEDTIITIFYKDKYWGSNYVKFYSNLSNENFKEFFETNDDEEEENASFFCTSQIISSIADFQKFYYK